MTGNELTVKFLCRSGVCCGYQNANVGGDANFLIFITLANIELDIALPMHYHNLVRLADELTLTPISE